MNIGKATLFDTAKVSDAIKLFSESNQVVFVINNSHELLGIISDGDLRRGLMRGYHEKDDILRITNTSPVLATHDFNQQQATSLMIANKIEFLPIINNKRILKKVYFLEKENQKSIKNKFVIMAGGRGTRLLPLTEKCPKPMLRVARKPILEHIILKAKSEGFINFSISVNHLSEKIVDYFGNGERLDVNIEYLHETQPLGTAGAIGQLLGTTDLPLFITNGDIFSEVSFTNVFKFHNDKQSFATMVVIPKDHAEAFGVVEISNDQIVGFQEKPVIRNYINSGMYCISPLLLEYIEPNTYCDMPTLFQRAILDKKNVLPYVAHEQWLDVGRPGDFQVALNKYEKNSDK